MNFSEEWKSLWPISSVFSPPLLLSDSGDGGSLDSKATIGPLVFNPCADTLSQLVSSPSLSPLPPPRFSDLSLPRFLQAASSSSILPSTSSSIAAEFGPEVPDYQLIHNRLQLIRCPGTHLVLAFFSTGDNCDRVGSVLLSVKDNCLGVIADGDSGEVFMANNKLNHQIIRLLVNPMVDVDFSSSSGVSSFTAVGFLMAHTLYSVNWYSVGIRGFGSGSEKPVLDFIGSKLFKSCAIVHACWSPHLPEECLVLLEDGQLFLFDLESYSNNEFLGTRFTTKKLIISWRNDGVLEKGKWLSCEFSWHPRILIVAHSCAVFLVDLRSESSIITCLLKIEMMGMAGSSKKDQFVALSRARPDGFNFVVASNHLLFLCDVRKPLMPLLRWAHNLDKPQYISVFKLSDLRSHSKEDKYKRASESGYCILLGSLWNCEFCLFCYGPDVRRSDTCQSSRLDHPFYAWELPVKISLSAHDCNCGSCFIREQILKSSFMDWIDWKQRKDDVLGFGILDPDLHAQLFDLDSFGGFTLIRLMSSGKLESQRYCASWEFVNILEEAHELPPSIDVDTSLLYTRDAEEYKCRKDFKFLKLDFLKWHLKGNLSEFLLRKLKNLSEVSREKYSSDLDFHQEICKKLKACGVYELKPSAHANDVLSEISLPTSIIETALAGKLAALPKHLLALALSTYSEFFAVLAKHKNVPSEFLDLPDQQQLPPCCHQKPSSRSGKWSAKIQPSNALVGPVVPVPYLSTLHKLRVEGERLSADKELQLQCNKIKKVLANKVNVSDSGLEPHDDCIVSLADDTDEIPCNFQKGKSFSSYEPMAFSDKSSATVSASSGSTFEDERYRTMIFKKRDGDRASSANMESSGPEIFDSQCPIELKFSEATARSFGPKELKFYKLLKKQDSNFQAGCPLYQEFISRSNF